MGAPLTWRNVDAPDFRGALDGYRVASTSMDRAFSGLSDALGKFDTSRKEAAASALLNNAAGYTDPAALRQAIADGTVFNGVNRERLTPETLAALNNQTGTLLNQAVTQEGLNHSKVMNPLLVQHQRGANTGQELTNRFAERTFDTRVRQGEATLAGTLIGNQRDRFNLDVTRRNDADSQAALTYIDRLRSGTMHEQDARELLASPAFMGLSPGARDLVTKDARSLYPNLFGTPTFAAPGGPAPAGGTASSLLSVAAGPSAPGTAGTRQGNAYDTAYRFTPTPSPLTTMPIGQVLDYQRNTLLPGQGASPVGAFQINRQTLEGLAPRVLGSDWRNQQFTPEVQERLAQALFEQRKNGNLSETWSALPNRGVGGYANMTWEQVRPLIARAEVGAELPTLAREAADTRSRAVSATSQINNRLMQDNTNTVAPQFQAAMADHDTTIAQVVEQLRKGSFKGVSEGRLTAEIQELMQTSLQGRDGAPISGVTPALAGAILNNSLNPSNWVQRIFSPDVTADMSRARSQVQDVLRGTTGDRATQNSIMQATQARIATAQQNFEQASALLAEALKRPGMADRISAYRQQRELARVALEDLLAKQQGDETLQPRRAAPSNAPIQGNAAQDNRRRAGNPGQAGAERLRTAATE